MALKKGVGDDDWEEGFQADMAAIDLIVPHPPHPPPHQPHPSLQA